MSIATIGECRVCGRRIRLKADGTVWYHTDQRKNTGLPWSPCREGADHEPKDDSVQQENHLLDDTPATRSQD